jgi:protein O-GlcNAc transferase
MNINKMIQLAVQHYQSGNLQQAEQFCKEVLAIQPNNPDILYFLGIINSQLENYDLAINQIKRSIHLNSGNSDAYLALGMATQQKGLVDDAIDAYTKFIQMKPDSAEAHFNLGKILQQKGQRNDAITYFQKAIQFNPHFVQAYHSLAAVLVETWRFDEVINVCHKMLQINPSDVLAYYILGNTFMTQGLQDEAEKCFKRAIQIKPDDLKLCQAFLVFLSYYPEYNAQTIFSEHLKFAKHFEEPLHGKISPHSNDRTVNRSLKIGYVSPDFKRHAVASFIEPVLMQHNRDFFEIFCYSDVSSPDHVTKRIREYSNQWRNIAGLSDEKAAELIREDRIDILIDLAGHTGGVNRILLFARKPAPIQISWIGYLATTGLSTMDYRIADMYSDPIGMTEQFYTEKLIRLPESFLCYLPDRASPEVGPLRALSTGYITFGSFNNFVKVNRELIILWSRILKAVPTSRLVMKTDSFCDKTIRAYAVDRFRQRGIPAERIVLLSPDPSPKHLESYNLIDIGLDTFPFNGGATTCEAMWMGVPVITIAGTAYHSRVGVSLLSNGGLPDLVARTSEEYISIAVSLANDLKKLQILREHLRDMMRYSPLCDAKKFTLNLETCYRTIWGKWCHSE